MPTVTIYHNRRCMKSRQTLSLLQEKGYEPKIVDYLTDPPDEATLAKLLKKLKIPASSLIRKKEFKDLGLSPTEDEAALISLMAQNPKIIERPIVVIGNQARLGRPPESVLEILPE